MEGSDAVRWVRRIVDVSSSVGIGEGGGIIFGVGIGWRVGYEYSLDYWCVVVGLLRRHVPVLQTKRGVVGAFWSNKFLSFCILLQICVTAPDTATDLCLEECVYADLSSVVCVPTTIPIYSAAVMLA